MSSRSLKLCVFAIPSFAWRSLTGCAVDGSSSTTGPGNDAGDFIGVTPHDSGPMPGCQSPRARDETSGSDAGAGQPPSGATVIEGRASVLSPGSTDVA